MTHFYSSERKRKKYLGEIQWFPGYGIMRVAEGFEDFLTAEPPRSVLWRKGSKLPYLG